jgi:putative transposase
VNLTYRYRVKSNLGLLNAKARAVNFVWNFCNDTQKHALKWGKKWPGAFDLINLTAGSCKELGLRSKTVNSVCAKYEQSRRQNRRPFLRYRGSRSLGWIPFRSEQLQERADGFWFSGDTLRVFKSRNLPPGKIVDGGSFSQDARGNWFLNVVVQTEEAPLRDMVSGVGIDLGLKDFAALSTGEKIANPRHFRGIEERLGAAQRARKKRLARNIHARIANRRRDFLHKLSTQIVRDYDYIAVGNVGAAGLAKTKMAKSVNDVAWSDFRLMLRYKSIAKGAWFEEVSERFTTQTCSACGAMPPGRPQGIAGLEMRHWVCSACGCVHDRDHNAAINLLARHGHVTPAEGIAA